MMLRTFLKRSIPVVVAIALISLWFHDHVSKASAAGPTRFTGPMSSQPLALNADDTLLAIANPDNNSVTLFNVTGGQNVPVTEISVGTEPNGVAVSPDGTRVYAANTVSGTVSVVSVDRTNPIYGTSVVATIPVGTEPYGLALTPGGRKLYVANARSNSVSVIDTASNQVIHTIPNAGIEPRGIAITNGGGDDTLETVYVTQFLSLPVAGKVDGTDDAKVGHVTIISAATDTVTGEVILNPIADTGFKAAGDALGRIAAPAIPVAADFKFTTGAYPNQLNNIAIRGRFAFVPNTGASPNGPVRFDVNTESLLHVLDLGAKADAGKTINMHSAVAAQTGTPKRFITQPWAMAFKHNADEGYVVSAASNIVVKVKVDPISGTPSVQSDPTDSTRVLEIPTGKNPRGIIVNSTDKTAYVMNYVSRDVTVIDLTGNVEKVSATISSSSLPAPGTAADKIQIGKELYYTSIGVFDPPSAGAPAITGRMSNNGWGACSACHPFGLSDNVVWIFAAGPRRTVPQHADFAPGNPSIQKALNWSAIFDEEEDFEANIRGVSGGLGLIVLSDGVTQDPTLGAFTPASGGRIQLKVRGVGAWDALKAYVQSGIRAPISPASKTDSDVVAGRQLFIQSNCQSCHGSSQWTTSRVRYTPPPDPSLIKNAEIISELAQVGTFDPKAFNEVRATAAAPLGADGFNPPPLLSLFAFPQTFFHNGSAATLDAVMANVAHRTAGTGGSDYLTDPGARAQLIKFLNSIDGSSTPIDPATPPAPPHLSTGGTVSAASFGNVAPGSIASVFGTGLATSIQAATNVPLPKSLGGSSLTFGTASAAFFFASGNQLNIQIPWEAPVGNDTVTVTVGGVNSTSQANVVTYAPGIFTASQTGTGQGIIVGPTNTLAAPVGAFPGSQPVHPGDYVTIYCTGLGPVVNQPATGAVATASPLPATTPSPATATIGGAPATVIYSGLTPGSVGLYQVNAQVPAGVTLGNAVSLTISIGGVTSNTVTLAVSAAPVTFFSTGSPDGLIGTLSRPAGPGLLETETADDFVLSQPMQITSATFTGLLPAGAPLSSITDIEIEIYRVFPLDAANPPSGKVPTRVNSPGDNNFGASFDSQAGTLTFTASIVNPNFTVANTVVNGILASNPFSGGEGPATCHGCRQARRIDGGNACIR